MLTFVKKNWLSVSTFIITAFILFFTVLTSIGGIHEFTGIFKSMDALWFIIMVGFVLAYWVLDSICLHILTLTKERGYRFSSSLFVAMLGFLYSALTPFATGGQPVQIYEMNKKGIKPGVASAVITLKSLIFQISMLLFALVSCLFSWNFFSVQIKNFYFYVIFGAICNAVFIGFIILLCIHKRFILSVAFSIIHLMSRLKIIKNCYKARKSTFVQVSIFSRSMKRAAGNKAVTFICFIVTFIQLSAFYAIPYCIYRSFHLSGHFLHTMMFANALIVMITAFVPLPGGSGAAEGSFYIFFKTFFGHKVVSAMLVWRIVTYYFCIVSGVFISVMDFAHNKVFKGDL